jgi:glycosyltransferase involved in cell wall biosynthesis
VRAAKVKPLVTIAVLTYKRPHLLPRALGSVARQTYKPLEVYVVDDATPGTENEEIVRSFKKKIPGLVYIKRPQHVGCNKNYLFCTEQAKGEFILWLCDDDEISPTFVEASVEVLLEHPEASFSAAYQELALYEKECTTFPESYMDDSWFRRALIFTITNGCGQEGWMRGLSWEYGVHRTEAWHEAIKRSLEKFPYWWPNRDVEAASDCLFLLEALLIGKVVPVTDKKTILTTYCNTEKEYTFPGGNAPGFIANQMDKLRGAIFWVNIYWINTKQVYLRGGLLYAIPFAALCCTILGYKLALSLFQQLDRRVRAILPS